MEKSEAKNGEIRAGAAKQTSRWPRVALATSQTRSSLLRQPHDDDSTVGLSRYRALPPAHRVLPGSLRQGVCGTVPARLLGLTVSMRSEPAHPFGLCCRG